VGSTCSLTPLLSPATSLFPPVLLYPIRFLSSPLLSRQITSPLNPSRLNLNLILRPRQKQRSPWFALAVIPSATTVMSRTSPPIAYYWNLISKPLLFPALPIPVVLPHSSSSLLMPLTLMVPSPGALHASSQRPVAPMLLPGSTESPPICPAPCLSCPGLISFPGFHPDTLRSGPVAGPE
jgi:hypothetical protein